MREDLVGRALESVREFQVVLPLLTREEVEMALTLESGTQRRVSVISGLIGRAGTLYTNQLKEKYQNG